MQKTTYTCDKCGAKIDENHRFKITRLTGLKEPITTFLDVCDPCIKKFCDGLKLETVRYYKDFAYHYDPPELEKWTKIFKKGKEKAEKSGEKEAKKQGKKAEKS